MTAALRIAGIGCVLAGVAAVPVGGQDIQLGMLGMLSQLQKGAWEIRHRSPGKGIERICLQDGRGLIQLRHKQSNCERQVIDDSATEVAVQYTCRGRGYGLTRIRKETDRLVQIDSQGVADGLPFSFSAEGRHVGACTS